MRLVEPWIKVEKFDGVKIMKRIERACRTCYSADYPINIYNSTDDEEKMLKLIERVISSGHYSTIEHI